MYVQVAHVTVLVVKRIGLQPLPSSVNMLILPIDKVSGQHPKVGSLEEAKMPAWVNDGGPLVFTLVAAKKI